MKACGKASPSDGALNTLGCAAKLLTFGPAVSGASGFQTHSQMRTAEPNRERKPLNIHGGLLIRNTGLMLACRMVPMLVALVTIPYVIRGLGTERFGLLSLAWMVVGLSSIADLGLGRATTKFVAGALGSNNLKTIPGIIWTSVSSQLVVGFAAALALYLAAPFLVTKVLKVSPRTIAESRATLAVISLAIPLVLVSSNLSGVLQAMQRFDLFTWVQIPLSLLTSGVPALGTAVGLGLPGIMWLFIGVWAAGALAYLAVCLRVLPSLKQRACPDARTLRALLVFGGWVTVCSVLVPLFVSADRFFIASLLSLRDVAYYSAPYEMVFKLMVIPGALGMILFPAFSTLSGAALQESLINLYVRSVKHIVLLLGPVAVVAATFGKDVLRLWLGADFMSRSTLVFQILVVGVLLNGIAQMPANLLDGIGRPDLRAKVFLGYLPVYAAMLWIFTVKIGIVGAALAWSLRATLELVVFFVVSRRLLRFPLAALGRAGVLRGLEAIGCLALVLLAVRCLTAAALSVQAGMALLFLGSFVAGVWKYVLDDGDKSGLRELFTKSLRTKEVPKSAEKEHEAARTADWRPDKPSLDEWSA
ncbi:MAG TPA: flippase [Terriglobia bacterium]|nr:flippase [Terriglobia bacterium]